MNSEEDDVTQDWVSNIGRAPAEGEEWLADTQGPYRPLPPRPQESPALADLVQPDSPPPALEESERLPGGRHRADTLPTTGPLHRLPRGPRGVHHEDKARFGPWVLALALTVLVILSVWGAYKVGQWSGADARDTEWIKRPVETVTATVTPTDDARPASAAAAKPKPVPTVTKTRTVTPRPRVSVSTRTVPGPEVTRWRTTPGPTRTVRAPAPTVTRTTSVETCYEVSGSGEYLGEITCP